jgi:hypothetical protein
VALRGRWEEERQRCGGQDPPPQPPDPPRTPKPLCLVVDYVRSQFQVPCQPTVHVVAAVSHPQPLTWQSAEYICNRAFDKPSTESAPCLQAIADQQAAAAAAAQPGSQLSAGSAASHGGVNLSSSSARSASALASPARHALLAMTQAANLAASGGADLSAGSGHGAASGSTGGAGAIQGQQPGSGQQGDGGTNDGIPLVDEAIVSMTQVSGKPSAMSGSVCAKTPQILCLKLYH